MHKVSANFTLPTILNTLKPAAGIGASKARSATSTASTTGAASSSTTTSGSGLDTTFLSLLSKELQNQDPTDPVDSTAMVGQMISLNQLDQLISINQTLLGVATPPTTAGATPAGSAVMSTTRDLASILSPSTAGAASSQLPFDPNTMMPLSSGSTGAVAASVNSSLNAATLGLSGTNNNSSGGK